MLNKTKMALATALIFGSASAVLAGEGSPDINVPQGSGYAASQQVSPFRDDVLDVYASAQRQVRPDHRVVRPFTTQEKELFNRETGTGDGY